MNFTDFFKGKFIEKNSFLRTSSQISHRNKFMQIKTYKSDKDMALEGIIK